MKEYDNIKIHISSNFILSVGLLIMFDTLLLRPSLHFTTLRYTSPNYTSLHLGKTKLKQREITCLFELDVGPGTAESVVESE
jgi:hypothetical protein